MAEHNSTRRARRGGQVTVEFALLFTGILVPSILGLTFISQLLWVYHSVNDWTRQGAGYAISHCWEASSQNVLDFMQQNVPLMPYQQQFRDGTVTITVSYFSVDPTTGILTPFACDGDCSTTCIPDRVTVSVTGFQYSSFFTYLGLAPISMPTFQASAAMESAGCDPEQGFCLP
jgi:hypothetical protein